VRAIGLFDQVPEDKTMAAKVEVDQLISARHAEGSCILVRFADGLSGTINVCDLGLDPAELRMAAVRLSVSGTAAEFEDVSGSIVAIDSSILRAQIDPEYARQLEKAAAEFPLPKMDPAKGAHKPPQSWYDEEDRSI
jgi:hypothetical protein